MKRMNILVEEKTLEEVRKKLKTESYSATINMALEQILRLTSIQDFCQFIGSGAWEGELSLMRNDSPPTRKKARKK